MAKKLIKATKSKKTDKPKKDYKIGYKKPDPSKQFKKGQSGNPHGVSKERAAAKAFTATQLTNAINLAMSMTVEEAEQVVNDRTLTLPEKVVIRAIVDSAQHGNYSKFYEIAEFLLGKVPNKIEVITSLKDKIEDREKLKQTIKAIEDEV